MTIDAIRLSGFEAVVAGEAVAREGTAVAFDADGEARAQLARELDLAGVEQVTAALEIAPRGKGAYLLLGRVQARLLQSCVVTLAPVPAEVDEAIDIRFVPATQLADTEADPQASDLEPLEDGEVPVGRTVRDTVALALDPYPRAQGVAFKPQDQPDAAETSPFAALKGLRETR